MFELGVKTLLSVIIGFGLFLSVSCDKQSDPAEAKVQKNEPPVAVVKEKSEYQKQKDIELAVFTDMRNDRIDEYKKEPVAEKKAEESVRIKSSR